MLNVQPQTLWWLHAPSPVGFVRISKFSIVADNMPTSGTYMVVPSALTVGRNIYTIQYCERPVSDSTVLCSDGVPFVFNVRPAHFAGDYRRFVPVGQSLTLTWSGSGNYWFLEAPTLNFGAWVSQSTYTVPASVLTPGVHSFKLISCLFTGTGATCSNRVDIYAPQAGVVTFMVTANTPVSAGNVVGSLAPTSGGAAIDLKAPRAGTFVPLVAGGSSVAANADLAIINTDDKDTKEVIVGQTDSLATWTSRTWSTDFTGAFWDTQTRPTTGDPLDIAFDSSGGIWQLGEFSSGIAHVNGGALTHHDVPLARTWNSSSALWEKMNPFGSSFYGLFYKTFKTDLGERVVDTGSAVWFTQGGGFYYPPPGDYSRLVRFDRNGVDSPGTPDDDRICAIHVPGDHTGIIGIAWDGQRVWFAESRGVLGWFDPATMPCNNFLDYSNSQAVQAVDDANRCITPTQEGCIHEIPLPALPAHVVIDPADGYVWFSFFFSATGMGLGRYPLAGGAVETFPLPNPIDAGGPWQLRADAEAVYIGEYGDSDLIRFDKHGTNCTALVNGRNPCMQEIHVPLKALGVALHSIGLVGNRLWFTLANEGAGTVDRNASTFGYVDAATWKAGAPAGVLYTGLDTLGDLNAGRYHSFRGIDVTPQGQVALADMRTDEIVRLDPRP